LRDVIVQLAREPGAFRLLRMKQQTGKFTRRFLGLFPLGNVQTRSNVTSEVSLIVVSRPACIGNPPIFAVMAPEPVFHDKRLPRVKCPGVRLEAFLQVVRMHTFGPAAPDILVQRAAGEFEPGFV
jgi:hypothetical protein